MSSAPRRANGSHMHRTLPFGGAAALGLLVVAGALAALPQRGKSYTGFTNNTYTGGGNVYKAPVSFKVSADGKQLLGFKYAAGDCGGMGGESNPWGNPGYVRTIATIPVDAKGNFSIKNSIWRGPVQGADASHHKVTLSTVSGHFQTASVATGTIKVDVTIDGQACPDANTWTFRATTG